MKKILFTLVSLILPLAALSAQDGFRAAYFMKGYQYAHKMNPAFAADRNYLGVGTGRIGVQTQSNLGASTFLYPSSGNQTVTFLNEEISSDRFLRQLRKDNPFHTDIHVDAFNLGFYTQGDKFHTISISAHVQERASLPYDLFRFLKDGTTDGAAYDLGGVAARLQGYAQVAYGLSMPLTDGLRVGGKVKALVGLARADARFDRFDVQLSSDRWAVATDGRLTAANVPSSASGNDIAIQDIFDFDQYTVDNLRPSGFGLAVDLGASWDVLPWLQLSASVLDIGLMHWKLDSRLKTSGTWEYTGLEEIDLQDDGSFSEQIEAKFDALSALTRFSQGGDGKGTSLLPVTAYVGAKAHPCDWFSAGLLGTGRLEGRYSWAELRGALNLEPAYWFGLTAGAAYGTFGPKLSSAMNLRLGLLALFVGAELSSPYYVTKNGAAFNWNSFKKGDDYPLPRDNMNLGLTVGVNMVFGRSARQRAALGE